MEMTKRARVTAALQGEPVDRPPISFWMHNFGQENSAEALAAETVRVYRRYDWDFIKIQSRASVFAEMWGSRYRFSDQVAVPPTLLDWPIRSEADLRALRPADPTTGALGEQLDALRAIRRAVGPDVPILQTVFAPAMVLSFLVNGVPDLLAYVRQAPAAAHAALAAIRETLAAYAQAAVEHGADGIFFAVKAADADQMTRANTPSSGCPMTVLCWTPRRAAGSISCTCAATASTLRSPPTCPRPSFPGRCRRTTRRWPQGATLPAAP